MDENRLIDIEIKLTRQEDLLESLNQMVYQQSRKIEHLEAICAALARRIPDAPSDDPGRQIVHELPPHY